MSNLFKENKDIPVISEWDVSNVTNTRGMFNGATNFISDISKWDVSNVTNMAYMFADAKRIVQDISNWKVNPNVDTEENV